MCLYPFFHLTEGLGEEGGIRPVLSLCLERHGGRKGAVKGETGWDRRTQVQALIPAEKTFSWI